MRISRNPTKFVYSNIRNVILSKIRSQIFKRRWFYPQLTTKIMAAIMDCVSKNKVLKTNGAALDNSLINKNVKFTAEFNDNYKIA